MGSISINGSAMFECGTALISGYALMGQVSAFGLTALSVDLSVKFFACRLTFMFQLAQVFTTSSSHGYRMPMAWRIPVALFPGR